MNYFSRSSRPFPNKKSARCTPGITPRHDDLGALQTTDLIQDGSHFRDWKMCTCRCQMKMMKSERKIGIKLVTVQKNKNKKIT